MDIKVHNSAYLPSFTTGFYVITAPIEEWAVTVQAIQELSEEISILADRDSLTVTAPFALDLSSLPVRQIDPRSEEFDLLFKTSFAYSVYIHPLTDAITMKIAKAFDAQVHTDEDRLKFYQTTAVTQRNFMRMLTEKLRLSADGSFMDGSKKYVVDLSSVRKETL